MQIVGNKRADMGVVGILGSTGHDYEADGETDTAVLEDGKLLLALFSQGLRSVLWNVQEDQDQDDDRQQGDHPEAGMPGPRRRDQRPNGQAND